MRLRWITVGLVLFLLLPFLLWGDRIESVFTVEGTLTWLRGSQGWAAEAAVLLLVSDLLLPIPATVVMSALGILYGPLLGGLSAGLGAFASGLAGYLVCSVMGRPAAEYIVDSEAMEAGERLFERSGGWMVALSRWLPIFPEAVACMAGLVRMPLRRFVPALACGVAPLGFTFAAVGHLGVDGPVLTLSISALAPAVLWLLITPWLKRPASVAS